MSELKPCPFCGRQPNVLGIASSVVFIGCGGSGCSATEVNVQAPTLLEAAKLWNRRTPASEGEQK